MEKSTDTKSKIKKEKVGIFTQDEKEEKEREKMTGDQRTRNLNNMRMEEANRQQLEYMKDE